MRIQETDAHTRMRPQRHTRARAGEMTHHGWAVPRHQDTSRVGGAPQRRASSRMKSIVDVSVLIPGAFRAPESQAREELWSGLPRTVVPSVSYAKMAAGAGERGGW